MICYERKINPQFALKTLKTQLMWCYRFIKLKGFAIRRISHIGQIPPDNINKIKEILINELIKHRKFINLPHEDNNTKINMDETPCFLEMGFNTTLEFRGKKMWKYYLQVGNITESLYYYQ